MNKLIINIKMIFRKEIFLIIKTLISLALCTEDILNQLPLRIKQQPQSQIAQKGAKIVFKCEYEAVSLDHTKIQSSNQLNDNLNIKIGWLLNSNLINDQKQYVLDRNRLIIISYDPLLHSGQYRCIINNTQFTPPMIILSEPANLTLASIDHFEQSKNDNNDESIQLNMSEGNVAIISCKLPNSNPPAQPIFYFNDAIITQVQQHNSFITSNNRYRIFPSGNLQISNVKYADSGTYRCSARNPITNEIRVNPKKTVLKVYEPFGTKLPEIVYVPIDTNRVTIGSNLTLECVANGAPVPLVSWEKFGGILPEKRSFQVFGNLILTNVQLEDKGTYVCRAENGPGQATFKTSMIDVFESPSLINESDDLEVKYTITVKPGHSVELKCPIKARPRPSDIQWFFQGHKLSAAASNGGATLSLRSFQSAKSTGIYQCYAQNEYGFAQANLLVMPSSSSSSELSDGLQKQLAREPVNEILPTMSKRPMIIMGPQNTTIYEGQSVVLLCITSETSSGGSTQINWLQNDLIIEPTLMRRFEINQLLGNLRIVSIQKSDSGVYKCIASNEFGMSTAEAYVQVKTSNNPSSSGSKQEEQLISNPKSVLPLPDKLDDIKISTSRPIVQQIGIDKILLKWHLIDKNSNNLDTGDADLNNINIKNMISYFKVDYKTNKQQQQIPGIQPHTWLTIDEQIDAKKREYILTDLSKYEIYRFRITAYFTNGEIVHSYQSARFKLESSWSNQSDQSVVDSSTKKTETTIKTTGTVISSTKFEQTADTQFKLSQTKVQITQIWAISPTSLGLKWKIFFPLINKTKLTDKINGFYIYYRKSLPEYLYQTTPQTINIDPSNSLLVPLYNYTRINLPISIIEQQQQQESSIIDTYIITNLDPSTQYEIKMTCYNLNGDLCSFSNNIHGLTTSLAASVSSSINNNKANSRLEVIQQQQNKSRHNELLFMILGIVLGVLTLLLIIFIVMCVARHRQHQNLLAQLHNTSQKLTSSSCPTLIYEDSLRNGQQQHQNNSRTPHHLINNLNNIGQYTAKLLDTKLFLSSVGNNHHNHNHQTTNDSNSTNSQSMSTTTSSMTTPPALISAQTNADLNLSAASSGAVVDKCLMTPSHILMLNGNTVSSAAAALAAAANGLPPPIPQVPPPPICSNTSNQQQSCNLMSPGSTATLSNRININLNPLNGYLERSHPNSALSPLKTSTINQNKQQQQQQQQQENFYHTLTTMGNLPTTAANINDLNEQYADYNNTTLNMRAHFLLKQQQQQQQILINTLKTINLKQQQLAQLQTQLNPSLLTTTTTTTTNTMDKKKSSKSSRNADSSKSPSTASMRRNNSVNSSKRSRKSNSSSSKHNNSASNNIINDQVQQMMHQQNSLLQLQQQQQQQQKNYYLLPNIRPQQHQQNILNRNVYNDVDLLALEAAIQQNNIALINGGGGNLFLINNPYQSTLSTFSQQSQIISSPKSPNNNSNEVNNNNNSNNIPLICMNLFENNQQENFQAKNQQHQKIGNETTNDNINCIYESSDDIENINEQEPMLNNLNNHASTGLLAAQQQQQSKIITSQENCKI